MSGLLSVVRRREGMAPAGHRETVEALGNREYLVSCRDCAAARWAGSQKTASYVRLDHAVRPATEVQRCR